MNSLLEQIANIASDDLKKLIAEGHDDIVTAIHKATAEAQLQETKPKFSLGFKISVDLDKSTFDCDLGWTLKQNLSVSHQIEDPMQPRLPIEGESDNKVIISTGETSVTLTQKQMDKALKKLGKN